MVIHRFASLASTFSWSSRQSRRTLRAFAATNALALLLVAGAQAETFPAIPTKQVNTPPLASPTVAPAPLGKTRLASSGIPFAGLSIQAQDGVSLLYTNQGGYGFGTLNPLDTPTVQAVFHLKNETDKPITLERLLPSCHCTHADSLPLSTTLPTIAPGGQVAIRVTVDLAGHPAGNLEKSVSVFVTGHSQPAAVLAMEGVLTPLVALSPLLLDFGTVSAGKEKMLPLTVTVDPRLVADGKLPTLRSSNASLRLVPQPTIITLAVAKTLTDHKTPTERTPKTITRTYNVILSAYAPLGPVNGTLSFDPPVSASSGTNLDTTSVAAQAFAGGSVLLLGQVQGEVSALPQSLTFGTIKQGEEATRQIALMGDSAGDVKDLSVASASAYVSAKLLPLSPMFGAGGQLVTNARTLLVTLSPQAPAGNVQTQLKVSLSSGRRLIIPISAYVTVPVTF